MRGVVCIHLYYNIYIFFFLKTKLEEIESWISSSFTEPSHSAPTCMVGNNSKNNLNLKYAFDHVYHYLSKRKDF